MAVALGIRTVTVGSVVLLNNAFCQTVRRILALSREQAGQDLEVPISEQHVYRALEQMGFPVLPMPDSLVRVLRADVIGTPSSTSEPWSPERLRSSRFVAKTVVQRLSADGKVGSISDRQLLQVQFAAEQYMSRNICRCKSLLDYGHRARLNEATMQFSLSL